MNPKEDGVTHLNVYSKALTELGRFLSNFTPAPFIHPEDGKFKSVEGYWYWLSCKDENLRNLYGYTAKAYGRTMGGKDWVDDDEFKRKIRLAIKAKINAYPEYKEEFMKNKLPFVHYYVYGEDYVVEPKEGAWIMKALEELKDEYQFEAI